jgi:integrase
MSMSAEARAPAAALDMRPVLESAPLRPGFERTTLSRVGDMRWDLSPAVFRTNAQRCAATADFTRIHDLRVLKVLKVFLYIRLNFQAPGMRRRLPPASLFICFSYARRFLEFVGEARAAGELMAIDQPLLDDYLAHLKHGAISSRAQIANHIEIVRDFHLFAPRLGEAGLRFAPWRGRSSAKLAGVSAVSSRYAENRTPRIPEPVIEPMLAWSIKYLKLFAPDIFAAREEWEAIQSRAQRIIAEEAGLATIYIGRRRSARVHAFISERKQAGRGIPTYTRRVAGRYAAARNGAPLINWALIEHMTASSQIRDAEQDALRQAAADSGFEIGGMDTPVSIDPDAGLPWRARFDPDTLAVEERMLETAAYIVCAYLTGMRDCEVQAMRAGCCKADRSEDGLVMRYRVRSKVFKSAPSGPEEASWVTIAPTAEAIAIVERLTERIRQRDGDDSLWRTLHPCPNALAHIAYKIVPMLNRFRDHLNAQFGSPDALIVPNGPDGKSWHFTTRQFRRTIAWHIANRPFGAVAGMIQYKHASVAAFEGYAGSSASGFRAEIARERALGQIEDIFTYFERHRDGLSVSVLDDAAAELDPLQGAVVDRKRLKVLLRDLAKNLHVGVLADCFFDPAHALCLKRATDLDPREPAVALCEPTRCPNACFTDRHRPIWIKARDEAKALLREKRLSQAQRSTLESDIARYERVISAVDAP